MLVVPDFAGYLEMNRHDLMVELAFCCQEIFHLDMELGTSRAAEENAKAGAWMQSGNIDSITARQMEAKIHALSATVSTHELTGVRAARIGQRDFIMRVLDEYTD